MHWDPLLAVGFGAGLSLLITMGTANLQRHWMRFEAYESRQREKLTAVVHAVNEISEATERQYLEAREQRPTSESDGALLKADRAGGEWRAIANGSACQVSCLAPRCSTSRDNLPSISMRCSAAKGNMNYPRRIQRAMLACLKSCGGPTVSLTARIGNRPCLYKLRLGKSDYLGFRSSSPPEPTSRPISQAASAWASRSVDLPRPTGPGRQTLGA
jgi:hypothetical protein